MDHLIQLHEQIEVHYHVDCYQAQLWVDDGNRMVWASNGISVEDALYQLKTETSHLTLAALRKLPAVVR